MSRHGPRLMMNQLQIFAARMQDRDPPRLLQNLPQAAEIADGDGIDERQLFSIKQLKQTQLRKVGAGTHKFGIDGERRVAELIAPLRELPGLGNQLIIHDQSRCPETRGRDRQLPRSRSRLRHTFVAQMAP